MTLRRSDSFAFPFQSDRCTLLKFVPVPRRGRGLVTSRSMRRMVRAILFDLGDTLIDFEPMDTRAVFRQAADLTYKFLADRGHSLPSFQAYCRRQFRAVRWAYLWAKLRRREFNSLRLLASF